jgi:hypothetical protein
MTFQRDRLEEIMQQHDLMLQKQSMQQRKG